MLKNWLLDIKLKKTIYVMKREFHPKLMLGNCNGAWTKSKSKKKIGNANVGWKGRISKKHKFYGKWFNCDRVSHKAMDCRLPKKIKNKEANVIEDLAQEIDDTNFCVVISKVDLVGSIPKNWWINTIWPAMYA